jgi:hypothetical protein
MIKARFRKRFYFNVYRHPPLWWTLIFSVSKKIAHHFQNTVYFKKKLRNKSFTSSKDAIIGALRKIQSP